MFDLDVATNIRAKGSLSVSSGLSVLIPSAGGPVGSPRYAVTAWNFWPGDQSITNTYAVYAYGARSGIRSEASANAVEAFSTSGTGVYGETSYGSAYGGSFRGTENGLYGKGSTYGVYSDGPLHVNSSVTTKASGTDRFVITSDRRVKKDIEDYRGGLAELERVRPVTFKYNGLAGTETSNKEYVGVIAQELEEIAPYMVSSTARKLRESDEDATDIKQLDSSAFTYMLVNAIKELAAQNRTLAARVAAQDETIARILASTTNVPRAEARLEK
jgi:hypothetical protein